MMRVDGARLTLLLIRRNGSTRKLSNSRNLKNSRAFHFISFRLMSKKKTMLVAIQKKV